MAISFQTFILSCIFLLKLYIIYNFHLMDQINVVIINKGEWKSMQQDWEIK